MSVFVKPINFTIGSLRDPRICHYCASPYVRISKVKVKGDWYYITRCGECNSVVMSSEARFSGL